MVQVQKGAVKFKSIRAMARAVASKSGEPLGRVYIRLWKRINELGFTTSEAFHQEARQYNIQASA